MSVAEYRAGAESMRTETDLLRDVTQYLSARRIWFRRYNTRAIRMGRRLLFTIIGPGNKVATGHPDLMARAPASGKVVWIECKSREGKLSPEQIAFRDEMVHGFGDLYVEARTLDDVRRLFEPDHFLRSTPS